MKLKHVLLMICSFLQTTICSAQNKVVILVNNAEVPVHSLIIVHSKDRVTISLPLNGFDPSDKVIDSIKAQTCAIAGEQDQQQRPIDRHVTFLERTLALLQTHKIFGYTKVYAQSNAGNLEIIFDVFQISGCPGKYFWIDLYMSKETKKKLKKVQGFTQHFKFMMVNEAQ